VRVKVTDQELREIIGAALNEAGVLPKEPGTTTKAPAVSGSTPQAGSQSGKTGTTPTASSPPAGLKKAGGDDLYSPFGSLVGVGGSFTLDPDYLIIADKVLQQNWRQNFDALMISDINSNPTNTTGIKFPNVKLTGADLNKVLLALITAAMLGKTSDLGGKKFEPTKAAPCIFITGTPSAITVYTANNTTDSVKLTITTTLTTANGSPTFAPLTSTVVNSKKDVLAAKMTSSSHFDDTDRWYYADDNLVQETVRTNFDQANEGQVKASNEIALAIAEVNSDEFDDRFLLPLIPDSWMKFENENPYSMLYMAYSYMYEVMQRHGEPGAVAMALEWAISFSQAGSLESGDYTTSIQESRARASRLHTTPARVIMSENEIRSVIRAALTKRRESLREGVPEVKPTIMQRLSSPGKLSGKSYSEAYEEGRSIVKSRLYNSSAVTTSPADVEKIRTTIENTLKRVKATENVSSTFKRLESNLETAAVQGVAKEIFENSTIREAVVNAVLPTASIPEKVALDLLLRIHAGSTDAARFDSVPVRQALDYLEELRAGNVVPVAAYGDLSKIPAEQLAKAVDRISILENLGSPRALTAINTLPEIRAASNVQIGQALDTFNKTLNSPIAVIKHNPALPRPFVFELLDPYRTNYARYNVENATARTRIADLQREINDTPGMSDLDKRAKLTEIDTKKAVIQANQAKIDEIKTNTEFFRTVADDLNDGGVTSAVSEAAVSSHVRRAVQDAKVIQKSGATAFVQLNKLGVVKPRTGPIRLAAEIYSISASGRLTDEFYATLTPRTSRWFRWLAEGGPAIINPTKRALTAAVNYAKPGAYGELAMTGEAMRYAAETFDNAAVRGILKTLGLAMEVGGETKAVNNLLTLGIAFALWFSTPIAGSTKGDFWEKFFDRVAESASEYVPGRPDPDPFVEAIMISLADWATGVDENDFATGMYYLNRGDLSSGIIKDLQYRLAAANKDYFPDLTSFFTIKGDANAASYTQLLGDVTDLVAAARTETLTAGEVPAGIQEKAASLAAAANAIGSGDAPAYRARLNKAAKDLIQEMLNCFTSALTSGSKFKLPVPPASFSVLDESRKILVPIEITKDSQEGSPFINFFNFCMSLDPDYVDSAVAAIAPGSGQLGAEKPGLGRSERLSQMMSIISNLSANQAPVNPVIPDENLGQQPLP
jgi:hypothetical protein